MPKKRVIRKPRQLRAPVLPSLELMLHGYEATAEEHHLTEAQERFCRLYAMRGDWSATECAVKAGFSEKSARQQASLLLAMEKIRFRIDDIINKLKQTKMTVKLRVDQKTEIEVELTRDPIVRASKYERARMYNKTYMEERDRFYDREFRTLSPMWQDRVTNRHAKHRMDLDPKMRGSGRRTHFNLLKNACKYAIFLCDQRYGDIRDPRQLRQKANEGTEGSSTQGQAG